MIPALLRLILAESMIGIAIKLALIFRVAVFVFDMRTQQMNDDRFLLGAGSFSTSWNGFSTLVSYSRALCVRCWFM